MDTPDLAGVIWRKSTLSSDNGACVEVAELADGSVAVRNSNHPQRGALSLASTEMTAFLEGCKAGEFDDLIS